MVRRNLGFLLFLTLWLLVLSCRPMFAQGPTISAISPTSGHAGIVVSIAGSGFSSTQGSSTITL
jgi:hypothetical protein